MKTPKLKEIAERIEKHLAAFERNPVINKREGERTIKPYYCARAFVAGARVNVIYVTFQGGANLKKAEALAYLEWLDKGNVGKHFDQQRQDRKVKP